MFTHASTTAKDGTQFRRQGAEEDEAGKVKLLKEKEALNEQWAGTVTATLIWACFRWIGVIADRSMSVIRRQWKPLMVRSARPGLWR